MGQIIRIVPAHAGEGKPASTMGTRVFAGETEIGGILKIEMVAEVGDVWRAVLHVVPEPFEATVMADTVKTSPKPSIWIRAWTWLKGLMA